MSNKSFLITFLWVILGVLLIFAAVSFSISNAYNNQLSANSSLVLMLVLGLLFFIFLPGYSVFRVIKDWGVKLKTKGDAYFRKANEGIGLFMFTNILMAFYVFANPDKLTDLSILEDPIIRIGGFVSYTFLLWGSYNLAKSRGRSGWYAILSYLYPIGLFILLLLPKKVRK